MCENLHPRRAPPPTAQLPCIFGRVFNAFGASLNRIVNVAVPAVRVITPFIFRPPHGLAPARHATQRHHRKKTNVKAPPILQKIPKSSQKIRKFSTKLLENGAIDDYSSKHAKKSPEQQETTTRATAKTAKLGPTQGEKPNVHT